MRSTGGTRGWVAGALLLAGEAAIKRGKALERLAGTPAEAARHVHCARLCVIALACFLPSDGLIALGGVAIRPVVVGHWEKAEVDPNGDGGVVEEVGEGTLLLLAATSPGVRVDLGMHQVAGWHPRSTGDDERECTDRECLPH